MALVCRKLPPKEAFQDNPKFSAKTSFVASKMSGKTEKLKQKSGQRELSEMLVIEPIHERQAREQQFLALKREFAQKHAALIRMRLFVAALNRGVKNEEIHQ